MDKKRVLITGAGGFIGSALLSGLSAHARYCVTGSVRTPPAVGSNTVCLNHTLSELDMARQIEGTDCLVHTAARAHILDSQGHDAQLFNLINTEFSATLARAAASVGVKRFVFLSSAGVNGQSSEHPFTEADHPRPHTAYARSKHCAEQRLQEVAEKHSMELTILRLPLVYGPGAGGNLEKLAALIRRRWPLPLAGVANRRSLLGLNNLLDAVRLAIAHPEAANELFMLCDGRDVSTPDIIRALACGMQVPARLLYSPPRVLRLACKLLGHGEQYEKLCGSLAIDGSKFCRKLNWRASHEPMAGLTDVGRHFRHSLDL